MFSSDCRVINSLLVRLDIIQESFRAERVVVSTSKSGVSRGRNRWHGPRTGSRQHIAWKSSPRQKLLLSSIGSWTAATLFRKLTDSTLGTFARLELVFLGREATSSQPCLVYKTIRRKHHGQVVARLDCGESNLMLVSGTYTGVMEDKPFRLFVPQAIGLVTKSSRFGVREKDAPDENPQEARREQPHTAIRTGVTRLLDVVISPEILFLETLQLPLENILLLRALGAN
ncbi:unnamed protein product [Cylindrotheca closterium]|uniref:Uncharacterized protein n=1 Tax=Cylindrotheca closterium TaxID=2856 RepID=A0AAD2GCH5_9STRA|nr:unnamed protein product [Cylindrotheca closterium]